MATRPLLPASLLALFLAACGGGAAEKPKSEGLSPALEEADPSAASSPQRAAKPAVLPKVADSALPEPNEPLVRESFAYTGGSRDPFQSLLAMTRVGPELPDLTVVAIYYDTGAPQNSVVVLRERVTNKRYSLRPGDRLGRMRVTEIGQRDVTFTIDDFGTERQETISLRKQEVEKQ